MSRGWRCASCSWGVSRPVNRRAARQIGWGCGLSIAVASACIVSRGCNAGGERHVRSVVAGRLIRGAWQSADALRTLIARERIRTIVTLTAINHDDPKYVAQAIVVKKTGVDWLFVPMRGSRATVKQMADAADLLADPVRQPVFFHCVAGHHRTSLAHAAYLIRHRGWSATAAWNEVAALPWARPTAMADQNDKALIDEFAKVQHTLPVVGAQPSPSEVHDDEEVSGKSDRQMDRASIRFDHPGCYALVCLGSGDPQLWRGTARTTLPIRPDAIVCAGADFARSTDTQRAQLARTESHGTMVSRRADNDTSRRRDAH
jgi:protein tyrosine phosphatase (PTP) superfamily phosphohydrolase (DUF442 family)